MKKIIPLILFLGFLSCSKEVLQDHNISIEFPMQEKLQDVTISFSRSREADIVIDGTEVVSSLSELSYKAIDGGILVEYKGMSLVNGSFDDLSSLLEETFWAAPSQQWIFCLNAESQDLEDCGFVNCLSARGLSSENGVLYAGNNTYDRVIHLSANPISFTLKVKEAQP